MRKILPALLMVAVAALVLQVATADKEQVATLLMVKGSVTVSKAGTDTWEPAVEKASVVEGDSIRTEAGSSVLLQMADGSMTKVGPMSLMKVNQLQGADNALKAGLDMEVGRAWARVSRLSDESQFKVRTPTAVAGVRGTYFSSTAEEATSKFDVFEGEVEVSNRQDPTQSVVVTQQYSTTVDANKAPTEPSKMSEEELNEMGGGFSQEEFTKAKFEIQVSVSPQKLTPGQNAVVAVQVLKDGSPFTEEVKLTLQLSGSATFVESGGASITVTTDANGAASLEITDPVEETVSVAATMKVKVK